MALTKYASTEILAAQIASPGLGLIKSAHRANFDHVDVKPGYLYVRSRAISSRTNDNYDNFPAEEIKKGYRTFIGKPVFVNHHNDNHRRARGVIVDAALHEDTNPDGSPDTWAEVLMEVDAVRFPKLAQAILAGEIDRTSMGCFIPGTLITLADGTQKPIETIALGDEVLTHTGKIEPVTYVMDRDYSGVVYDVRTFGQASPLVMTDEHPVWIKRAAGQVSGMTGRKIRTLPAKTCLCGKDLDSYRSLVAHVRESKRRGWEGTHGVPPEAAESVGWVEAKDVRPGDWALTPVPEGVGHPGSYPFARLLGFYAAEGNLGWDRKRRPDGPVTVEWSFDAGGFKDEIEHVQEVVSLLEAMGYTAAGPYEKSNAYSIRCNSPALADQFLAYGGQHSWAKRLHPDVLRWSPDNQRALLDAYLLGDAHFRGELGHAEAGTVSQDLAQQMQLIAVRAGVVMTPPVRQHSPSAVAAGRRPKFSMQAVLDPVLTPVTQRVRARQAVLAPEGLWRQVTDVVMKTYQGKVYNFDVEGDDSYVAGDVAVHNCDVLYSVCSICNNKAETPNQYCAHIPKSKGMKVRRTTASGVKEDVLCYESCFGLSFFENSLLVEEPADPSAFVLGIDSSGLQTTATRKVANEWAGDGSDGKPYVCPDCGKWRNAQNCPHCDEAETMADLNSPRRGPTFIDWLAHGLIPSGTSARRTASKTADLGDDEALQRIREVTDYRVLLNLTEQNAQLLLKMQRSPEFTEDAARIQQQQDVAFDRLTQITASKTALTYGPGGIFDGYSSIESAIESFSKPVYSDPEPMVVLELKGKDGPVYRVYSKAPQAPGGLLPPSDRPPGKVVAEIAADGTVTRIAKRALNEVMAPAAVDTLRDEACPVCGEDTSYDGEKCLVCNFIRPPDEFMDPDLGKAKEVDLRQEQDEAGANPDQPWLDKTKPVDAADPAAGGKPWEQKTKPKDSAGTIGEEGEGDPAKPWKSRTRRKTARGHSQGEDSTMRPALSALAEQQKILDLQRRQIAALRQGLGFIAEAAGVSNHPRIAGLLRTADENPAAPVGWAIPAAEAPGSEAPAQTTEQALAPSQGTDDPTAVGAAPGTDVAPGATTSLDSTDTVLDVTLDLNEQDVTAPVAGTENLGEGAAGNAGSGRTETEVRVGDPTNPDSAFSETGWTAGKSEGRTIAALRLARLRMQAGIAPEGDDLSLGTSIASGPSTDEAIQTEIETLAKVVQASSGRSRQSVARNLVPRAAQQAQRTVPSFQSEPQIPQREAAYGPTEDEMAFE